MVLYENAASGNCYKVRLLLAHLGLEYERRSVDVLDRSNRPELLGGLNPALRVPTIVLDDGRSLGESGAILWYFGEGSRFVPDDAYARAQVLQWMFFEQYDHEPAIAVARFWLALSGDPDAYADRLPEKQAAGYRALDAMERHLEGAVVRRDRDVARRHRAVRVHARRRRGRVRSRPRIPRSVPGSDGSQRSRATCRSTPRPVNRERLPVTPPASEPNHDARAAARPSSGRPRSPAIRAGERAPRTARPALEARRSVAAAGARSWPQRLDAARRCAPSPRAGASNAASAGFGLLPSVTSPLWKRARFGLVAVEEVDQEVDARRAVRDVAHLRSRYRACRASETPSSRSGGLL